MIQENSSSVDIRAINEKIEKESAFVDLLMMEMNKVIVGQKHMVERLLIGLLGNGHIYLRDYRIPHCDFLVLAAILDF